MIFGRYRRGQVRGIDFSLAMIIFLLTMSQVIVLTTTFIENSQSAQDVNSELQTNQVFAREILTRPGDFSGSTDWSSQDTATLQGGWTFGLSDGNGTIDPVKMARLSTSNTDAYKLAYSDLESATNFDREFRIQFKSTIDVNISEVTDQGSDYQVVGRVVQNLQGLSNAGVTLFSIDVDSKTVFQSFTRTNQTGHFKHTVGRDSGTTEYHIVSAIAKYGIGNTDLAYRFAGNSSTITNNPQTILDGTSSVGNSLDVVPSFAVDNQTAVFAGAGSNHTFLDSNTNELGVPEDTLSLIVSFSSANDIAISTYPTILDGDLAVSISPPNPSGQSTSVTETILSVNGVLLKYSFKTWN